MANVYINLDLTSPGGDGSIGSPWGWDEWIPQIPALEADPALIINMQGSHQYSQNIIGFATITLGNPKIWAWTSNPWRINCTGFTFSLKDVVVGDGILLADIIEVGGLSAMYVYPTTILRVGYNFFGVFNFDNSIVLNSGVKLEAKTQAIVLQNCPLKCADEHALVADPYPPGPSNIRESFTNITNSFIGPDPISGVAHCDNLVDLTVLGPAWDLGHGNWMTEDDTSPNPNQYGLTMGATPDWQSPYLGSFRLGMPESNYWGSVSGPWWAVGDPPPSPSDPALCSIQGTLILDGNLTVNEDFEVKSGGLVIPVPDENLMKSFYSFRSNTFTASNGSGRSITSLTGNIYIEGNINGAGQGFDADQGPGCNSALLDDLGCPLPGYGATHAGVGEIILQPGRTAATPKLPYGNHETPVSLGSGAGSYHDIAHFYLDEGPKGGGAIKIEAHSGSVTINGNIIVDGQDGGVHTGGAAGGSIWIIGWSIDGTGLISAQGGATTALNAGGGGGGYISLWYDKTFNFLGTTSVAGRDDGKIFITQTEPIFEENFTGSIWNTKWWNPVQNAVVLNNNVSLTSPQNNFDIPGVTSIFSVSGKNITAQVDYTPSGTVISEYNAEFLLMADSYNWVGLARKSTGLFGISSVNGFITSSGLPVANVPITMRLLKIDSTFAYQFIDSTAAPETIYTDVIPELANLNFNIFLNLNKPDSSVRISQRRLSSLDLSHQYMQLDATPVDTSAVALNIYGGSSQYYGLDYTVSGDFLRWDMSSSNLSTLFTPGERVRVIYEAVPSPGFIDATFDSFKLFEGVVADYETREPVVYVDPDYGSDSSDGRQLNPLKNLFVATAWAKRGGTVVLYDGTYNPTSVARKDLTIRGAEGSNPLITSQSVQDTTGSGWETNALSFYGCEGMVTNVQLASSQTGIKIENSPLFEVIGNVLHDTSTGVEFVNCDPVVMRNKAHNVGTAFNFSVCPNSYIYSNLIYDSSVGINISDSSNIQVVANTIDGCSGCVVMQDSTVIVSSNNLTNSTVGVQAPIGNSRFSSFNNNYYLDLDAYSRNPDDLSNEIFVDPLYVDRISAKNYHLQAASPDISSGQVTYDRYFLDYDGATRRDSTGDIGAFQFIPDGTNTGDFYVTSAGDGHTNFGSISDPFRTLDKAMLAADSTIHIDTGYYDSYYLKLKNVPVSIGIFTYPLELFILYNTLTPTDITSARIQLPAFVNTSDISSVTVSVIGGGNQVPRLDYGLDFGEGWDYIPALTWKGFALDGFLATGDTIRTIFTGPLQRKAFTNLILEGHYSNLEKEKAIYVSPSGSDSTVLGGDGTNTGGNGTLALPYRTIDGALSHSSPGDFIVAISGEYPIFSPLDDRVLVPAIDRTALSLSQRVYEDLFYPNDFRAFGTTQSDSVPWEFDSAGDSSAFSGGGFLNLTFDGTNPASVSSTFQIVNDFAVSAVLRNAESPVYFTIVSPDNTMFFSYDRTNYTAGVTTGGITYTCRGTTLGQSDTTRLIIDYLPIDANDINNKSVPLHFLPTDCTDVAANIVGGVSQINGIDFEIRDSKISWDGYELDGEIVAGDILRVIYPGDNLSNPLPVMMSLKGKRFTIQISDPEERVVSIRDMVGSYVGPWTVSFFMI